MDWLDRLPVDGKDRRFPSGTGPELALGSWSQPPANRVRIGEMRAIKSAGPGANAMQQQTSSETFDPAAMVSDLNDLLRLKTTVIGLKMFATVEEMTDIPKIRRPTAVHTTDQIVSMASRLGWTVGITADDLVGAQCRAVIGLGPQDEKWLAGANCVEDEQRIAAAEVGGGDQVAL